MEIDFTRLRYFVAVAEELHFTRAAVRLMITTPPLSKQIKLLERELGGPLFDRGYHDVRLTALGAELLAPARAILRDVEKLKATASRITKETKPLQFGASAYIPSDFLALLQATVAGLAVPVEFSLPGSTAEVTAKLVSGHLDIGLIHLPINDKRLRHRVVARYRGAVAVRFDDPIAAQEVIGIEALRDRDVAIDFARPNPTVLAGLARRLNSVGVTRIVRATNGRGGELEMATQVFNRHLVALVTYAPASAVGRIFSPPEFKLVPIDESTWRPAEVGLSWLAGRETDGGDVETVVDHVSAAIGLPV